MNAGPSVLALIVCATLAGCVSGEPPATLPEAKPCGIEFGDPVVLGDGGPAAFVSEPAIAFLPDGRIAVAANWVPAHLLPILLAGQVASVATAQLPTGEVEPGGQNGVWLGDGTSFTALHDELGRLSTDGHQGNQDADIATTSDGGLHVALFGPAGVEVLSSRDDGETWTPSGILSEPDVDRQWIAAEGQTIWVSWRNTMESGIGFARSLDAGRTWERDLELASETFSHGPLTRANSTLLLPTQDSGDELQVTWSMDDGQTWKKRGTGMTIADIPGFVVPTTHDNGTLRLVWTDVSSGSAAVWSSLGSLDGAWSGSAAVTPHGMNALFPWPVLRPDGSVAVFYYSSTEGGDPRNGERVWDIGFSLLCEGAAQWVHGTVAKAVHHGAMCIDGTDCPLYHPRDNNDRSVGEVFEAGVAPDGRVWVTWTATTQAEPRSYHIVVAGSKA